MAFSLKRGFGSHRRFLILPILSILLTSGCFNDRGGGPSNSVLNLSPEQQLHGVMVALDTEKVTNDEQRLGNYIGTLDRTVKVASGKTKYDTTYYLALLQILRAELELRKQNPDRKKTLQALDESKKDLGLWRKGAYAQVDFKLLSAMIESLRLDLLKDAKERRKAYLRARAFLRALERMQPPFESIFTIGDRHVGPRELLLMHSELERRAGNYFEGYEMLTLLSKQDPNYAETPPFRIRKAELEVALGQYEAAADTLAEFRGRTFARSLYYDYGLWLLRGIFETLKARDPKYAIDIKTMDGLLKNAGGFYGKSGTGKLRGYIKPLSPSAQGYAEAVALYFRDRFEDARDLARDLVDDPKATENKYLAVDLDAETRKLVYRLIARTLEKTGRTQEAEIARAERMGADPLDTYEVALDKEAAGGAPPEDDLIKAFFEGTGEISAKKK